LNLKINEYVKKIVPFKKSGKLSSDETSWLGGRLRVSKRKKYQRVVYYIPEASLSGIKK
jgi:hypothetical protein